MTSVPSHLFQSIHPFACCRFWILQLPRRDTPCSQLWRAAPRNMAWMSCVPGSPSKRCKFNDRASGAGQRSPLQRNLSSCDFQAAATSLTYLFLFIEIMQSWGGSSIPLGLRSKISMSQSTLLSLICCTMAVPPHAGSAAEELPGGHYPHLWLLLERSHDTGIGLHWTRAKGHFSTEMTVHVESGGCFILVS